MIIEVFVSFETAKLLKEKGFDGECDYLYVNGDIIRAQGGKCNWNRGETLFTDYKNECSAPTLQMAMNWLLDTYKLHIVPTPYPHEDGKFYWAYKIAFLDSDTLAVMVVKQKAGFDSKENACEGAIKYCLENLI